MATMLAHSFNAQREEKKSIVKEKSFKPTSREKKIKAFSSQFIFFLLFPVLRVDADQCSHKWNTIRRFSFVTIAFSISSYIKCVEFDWSNASMIEHSSVWFYLNKGGHYFYYSLWLFFFFDVFYRPFMKIKKKNSLNYIFCLKSN